MRGINSFSLKENSQNLSVLLIHVKDINDFLCIYNNQASCSKFTATTLLRNFYKTSNTRYNIHSQNWVFIPNCSSLEQKRTVSKKNR